MRYKSTLLCYAAGLFLCMPLLAQEPLRATTEDGRAVVLQSDGTWTFFRPSSNTSGLQDLVSYQKPALANTAFQTVVEPFAVMYNPADWSLQESTGNVTRRQFMHRSGGLYGIVIAEKIPLTTEGIKDIAIANARKAAPDTQVLMEERRIVNGQELIAMKMAGTIQNVKFMYYGNYYGDDNGEIQVLCFTAISVFANYEKDCLDFINGLTINSN